MNKPMRAPGWAYVTSVILLAACLFGLAGCAELIQTALEALPGALEAQATAAASAETPAAKATATRRSKTPTAASTARATRTPAGGAGVAIATPPPDEGLPTIRVGRLPAQARETIALIERGGPFPYPQDGSTFQNREGLLPAKPSGYYKEYTVETPGASDRGARRIVVGKQGEFYYTDDHYGSFKRVIP